jgi:membrane protein required for colicin V production
MTVFDYVVIAVVVMSVLLGMWRGVVGEVLAIAAWVLAFIVARYCAPMVAPAFTGVIADTAMRLIAAWAVTIIAVLLVVAIARALLRLLLKAVGLGIVDRLLGACFGIARGALVVLFGVLLAGLTPLPKADWWRNAMLSPPFETVVLAAKPWMPPELAKRIDYR